MRAHLNVVGVIALILCAVAVPAHADSVIYNSSYNPWVCTLCKNLHMIDGGITGGAVTGPFNSSTLQFSNPTPTEIERVPAHPMRTRIGWIDRDGRRSDGHHNFVQQDPVVAQVPEPSSLELLLSQVGFLGVLGAAAGRLKARWARSKLATFLLPSSNLPPGPDLRPLPSQAPAD